MPKVVSKSKPASSTNVEAFVHDFSNPISEDHAKDMLGWTELGEDDKAEHLLIDLKGNRIACKKNLRNRQLYGSTCGIIAQEILRKRWRFNGEPIIIGNKGTVLNGQHTLIGFIMACQMWESDPEAHPLWKEKPVLTKLVVTGIEETDEVVNTMDTCKPRTLTDVIYRSDFFKNLPTSQRKVVARVLDYAVRMLWHRTGVDANAYAPKRTHAEALDFINRHPRLIKCVENIVSEDDERGISKILSPGSAAGLMYLMASCGTEPSEYHASQNAEEGMLVFDYWDKAEEFWNLIAIGDQRFASVRKSLAYMIENSGGGSPPERLAIIVKAWNAFVSNGEITDKDLKLKYQETEDGYKLLSECPTVGGVDVGIPSEKEDAGVSPEEVAAEMEKIRREKDEDSTDERKAAKKAAKKAGKPSPQKSEEGGGLDPRSFKEGETLWVTDPDNGEQWSGTYMDHYSTPRGIVAKIKVSKGYAGAGSIYDVNLKHLSRK